MAHLINWNLGICIAIYRGYENGLPPPPWSGICAMTLQRVCKNWWSTVDTYFLHSICFLVSKEKEVMIPCVLHQGNFLNIFFLIQLMFLRGKIFEWAHCRELHASYPIYYLITQNGGTELSYLLCNQAASVRLWFGSSLNILNYSPYLINCHLKEGMISFHTMNQRNAVLSSFIMHATLEANEA